ncbi:Disintegrin and metalloproteinase domain-containing protein 33 [Liparis tanakae]|uniref:Disintegrin and metalloproteinase domain-containing protein 33 n=1 Tax=Liparis tanakae TaxID=230148 RepID=A0A4Z2F1H5_9TELE|nr:Disintegrin and metalloproteinase domain-containing protein 33 [Liparis tanakae]
MLTRVARRRQQLPALLELQMGSILSVTALLCPDHCFYHGLVRGHPESWVALSTCSGVRGLISLNSSDTYYLEPIGGVDPLQHSLRAAEELPIAAGHCGHGPHATQANHIASLLRPFHSRVSLAPLEPNYEVVFPIRETVTILS